MEGDKKIKDYALRYGLVLGMLAKLHGYLEYTLEMYNLVATEKMAEKLLDEKKEKIEGMLKNRKATDSEFKTNIYKITRMMTKEERRIDGVIVVGLIRIQEEYIKKHLISENHFHFFFAGEVDAKSKKSREKIYGHASLFDLCNDIFKKFTSEENFFSTIEECNDFSNYFKHSNPTRFNELIEKMEKRMKIALPFNTRGRLFLWREILIDYIRAFEMFWLYVFIGLKKSLDSNDDLRYHISSKKYPVETIQKKFIITGLALRKDIKEFWLEMEQQHGISFNEKDYKIYFDEIEELCNNEF